MAHGESKVKGGVFKGQPGSTRRKKKVARIGFFRTI